MNKKSLLSKLKSKLNLKLIATVSLLLKSSLLISCASKLKVSETSPFEGGQTSWQGKIYFNQDEKKRNGDVVFLMKEPQRMRGDVTALMGIPLATFTMVENKFSLFLPREGESFSSTQGDLLVKKLTGLELSPVLLYEILSNKLPKGKDWKCNLNENDMPECQNLNNKVMISWLIKSHEAQDLEFAKDRTKVRINVSRHPVEKEIKDSVFQISTTR